MNKCEYVGNHGVNQNEECVFCCIWPCFKRFMIDSSVTIISCDRNTEVIF